MTRILPSSSEEAWRLRRLQAVLVDAQPSSEEIVRRLHRQESRERGQRSLKRVFAPVLWGILFGGLSCGTALAWAIHTGYIHLGSGAPYDDKQESSVGNVKHKHNLAPKHAAEPKLDAEQRRKIDPAEAPLLLNDKLEDVVAPDPVKTIARTSPTARSDSSILPKPGSSGQRADRNSTATYPIADKQEHDAADAPSGLSETDRIWMQVSELLRAGRYAAAEQALAPLLATGDVRAQQASLLLRLQLRVHTQAAVSEQEQQALQHLAESGLSSSIRRSAQRLLLQVRQ